MPRLLATAERSLQAHSRGIAANNSTPSTGNQLVAHGTTHHLQGTLARTHDSPAAPSNEHQRLSNMQVCTPARDIGHSILKPWFHDMAACFASSGAHVQGFKRQKREAAIGGPQHIFLPTCSWKWLTPNQQAAQANWTPFAYTLQLQGKIWEALWQRKPPGARLHVKPGLVAAEGVLLALKQLST